MLIKISSFSYATLASPASCLADWEALVLPSPIVPPKHAPSTQPSTSIATVADINAVLLLLAKAIQ